jgi:hypothetical protein
MDALWKLQVIGGPVPWIVYGTAVALVLTLLIRPYTPSRLLRVVIGVAVGLRPRERTTGCTWR